MKVVCLLGASGSVGDSTLKVLRSNPMDFNLEIVSVHSNLEKLRSIIDEFSPKIACVTFEKADQVILGSSYKGTKIYYAVTDLLNVLKNEHFEIVINGILGSAGILPTLEILKRGKTLAIANKETLVTFGPIIQKYLAQYNSKLIPVDSEHNALFQLLETSNFKKLQSIVLTASGGPFREFPMEKFNSITINEALNHPTWKMGKKISIDSATMANKGLEVIEAHYLFNIDYDKIEVVIHPQSIIHGMIENKDGSILSYSSYPDMIFPIAHALYFPNHYNDYLKKFKPAEWKKLEFFAVEQERYPSLFLAYEAGKVGGTSTAVFNAGNEEAVAAFLNNKIQFTEIHSMIESALEKFPSKFTTELDEIIEEDQKVREFIQNKIKEKMVC